MLITIITVTTQQQQSTHKVHSTHSTSAVPAAELNNITRLTLCLPVGMWRGSGSPSQRRHAITNYNPHPSDSFFCVSNLFGCRFATAITACSVKLSYNYIKKKYHTTLLFVLVLLIITYHIHRHILRKSKHWNQWTAIYQYLYVLNTKSDNISRSYSAFNIIQTSRNSYAMCICLLLQCTWQRMDSDEWWMTASCNKW